MSTCFTQDEIREITQVSSVINEYT